MTSQQEGGIALDTAYPGYSADELGPYRSVSSLAVAALVLGLLSSLSMFSPLLMVFPLAAIGVAGLALLKIDAAEGNLSGARLARWGLAMAVVFSSASIARAKVSRYLYQRQIDVVVQPWLTKLARGRHEDALGALSSDAIKKLSGQKPVLPVLPFIQNSRSADGLKGNSVVQALVQLGTPLRLPEVIAVGFELQEVQVSTTPRMLRAICLYRATNSRGESLDVTIQLGRPVGVGQAPDWLIDYWK